MQRIALLASRDLLPVEYNANNPRDSRIHLKRKLRLKAEYLGDPKIMSLPKVIVQSGTYELIMVNVIFR